MKSVFLDLKNKRFSLMDNGKEIISNRLLDYKITNPSGEVMICLPTGIIKQPVIENCFFGPECDILSVKFDLLLIDGEVVA
jgi:hypothetical protein